jgi:hypothetical protein
LPRASRSTTPATGVVMTASIFIASILTTVYRASTASPAATARVITPPKGTAMCLGREAVLPPPT